MPDIESGFCKTKWQKSKNILPLKNCMQAYTLEVKPCIPSPFWFPNQYTVLSEHVAWQVGCDKMKCMYMLILMLTCTCSFSFPFQLLQHLADAVASSIFFWLVDLVCITWQIFDILYCFFFLWFNFCSHFECKRGEKGKEKWLIFFLIWNLLCCSTSEKNLYK